MISRRVTPAMGTCDGSSLMSYWTAEPHAACLSSFHGGFRASADPSAHLLRQVGVEMKHEWVVIATQLRDNKRHPLDNQPADEINIAAKSVELRHDDWDFELAGVGECCGELWPTIQRIMALSRFDL